MAEADDVPVEQLKALEVDGDDEGTTAGYKPPAKVDLETIKNMDADDESLQKYKKDLLKGSDAQLDEGGSNVLVKKLSIVVEGRDDIDLDLKDVNALKEKTLKLKEGSTYKLKITFRVQREIVAGLRFFNATYRKGVRVDKTSYMVGSYGPREEEQVYVTHEESAPKGLLARGHYTIKSKFFDDDKNIYLEWEWAFDISKDW